MAIKFVLVEIVLVETVLVGDPLYMVNGTLLDFGKRYEDCLRIIFDQWQKLHFGLDALSNQKILKGIYSTYVLEPTGQLP